MMTILHTKSDIANAQRRLEMSFASRNPELLSVTIGYQSGSHNAEVMWLPTLDIWAFFGFPPHEKSPGRRFWNVFGIGKPHGLVSIVCEINPPLEGINRRVSGAFARTDDGDIALLHKGRLNVTGGMTIDRFAQHYRGGWVTVQSGYTQARYVHVGNLGSARFVDDIRAFVFEVERIKRLTRNI